MINYDSIIARIPLRDWVTRILIFLNIRKGPERDKNSPRPS